MTLDLTAYDPMLKEHYAPGVVANMAFQKNKAIGMMGKSQKRPGGGREWNQPIQYALPGGGSSTFATAIAASNNNSLYTAFKVTRKSHYRLAKVQNEAIEATADGDMDAFEPAFDEFDRAIQAEANYLNFRFFRSGGGYIGRVTNAAFATAVMTLDDAAGVWGVVKGDVLKVAGTDGTSGALRAGSLTVLSVQRTAGTITMTGNLSAGVAAIATNDYVFLDGDFGGSGTGLAPSGLADWIPDAAPSATTFYSVDRTTEPEMLGGVRVDGTDGRPLHELLVDMTVEIDNMGGEPNVVFAHPRALGSLTKQLEGKWTISQAEGARGAKMADIGYKGWTVTLEGHEITIYSDRCCRVKALYMLQLDTWTMFSAGPAPNFLQKRTGSIIKVSENYDGYESRIGEYVNFACKSPGWNAVGLTP